MESIDHKHRKKEVERREENSSVMDGNSEPINQQAELVSPTMSEPPWRINASDIQMSEGPKDPSFASRVLHRGLGNILLPTF